MRHDLPWLFLTLATCTLACSASPTEEEEDDDASALMQSAGVSVLTEIPLKSGNELRIAVDRADTVWFSDREARTLRIADSTSRYVYTAPAPAWGIKGPWFAGGNMLAVHLGSSEGAPFNQWTNELVAIRAGAPDKVFIHGIFDPTVGVDEQGTAVVLGSHVVALGNNAPVKAPEGRGFYAVSANGDVRHLGHAFPRSEQCEAQKFVVTSSRYAALVRCIVNSAYVSKIVTVSKSGGDAKVAFQADPKSQLDDVTAGPNDSVFATEFTLETLKSPLVEISLLDGRRKEIGSVFQGTLAYRDGSLYAGDSSGKIIVQNGGKTRVLAELGERVRQIETTSTGLVVLVEGKSTAKIVRVQKSPPGSTANRP